MLCKVICNSMGYNGHVYRVNEYVEVATSAEVKRLVSYGCVVKDSEKEKPDMDKGKVAAPEVSKTTKDYIPTGRGKGEKRVSKK